MDFLLIGGQPNTGKSETIHRIAIKLTSYTITGGLPPISGNDFTILLQGVNTLGVSVKILIHSATDNVYWIDRLDDEINLHSPDIVITSIRDINWQRNRVLKIVGGSCFEIPLARITRRNNASTGKMRYTDALNWYRNSIDNNVNYVLSNPPFNLL